MRIRPVCRTARTSAALRALPFVATALIVPPSALWAATVHVPSEQPTIQAGIAAAGDGGTVYVDPGVYKGEGNRRIDFGGMNVQLLSTGGAASTVIDCEGITYGFFFHTGEDSTSAIDGFTIKNCSSDYGAAVRLQGASPSIRNCVFASNSAWSGGGAIHANSTSDPRIESCTFTDNAAQFGGAAYMDGSYGSFRDCTFADNSAAGLGGAVFLRMIAETSFVACDFTGNSSDQYGGAIYSLDSESTFERCTFVANEAPFAGGAYLQSSYNPPQFTACSFVDNSGGGIGAKDADAVITRSIFAFDRSGTGIACTGIGTPVVTHSVVFGNVQGDSLCGTHSENMFVDPLLCEYSSGNVGLCSNSPCLPLQNPWGEQVGARTADCPECDSPVRPSSWATIKSTYR